MKIQLAQLHKTMEECNKTAGSSIWVPKGMFLQTSSWCWVDRGEWRAIEAMQHSYMPNSGYLAIGSFRTSFQPDRASAQCTSYFVDILYRKFFKMWYFLKTMDWLSSRFVMVFGFFFSSIFKNHWYVWLYFVLVKPHGTSSLHLWLQSADKGSFHSPKE